MIPSCLVFIVACSSFLPSIFGATLDKKIITVYVSFGTYNDEGISAWEVMEWEAQMNEGSPFDYKHFLSATLSFVWYEKTERSGAFDNDGDADTEEEISEFPTDSADPATGSAPRGKFDGALRLIDSPLVFGLDVDCPDPPGWIPPYPRDTYTCQEFKAALEIEVDKDAIHANGGYAAIAEVETELAVGLHVKKMYAEAIDDGTMEQSLRDIEAGKGAMRVLWDDPNLRNAWLKYRPSESGVPKPKREPQVSYASENEEGGPDMRTVMIGSIVGFVALFFCCSVCVGGRMGRGYPKDVAKKMLKTRKTSSVTGRDAGASSDVGLSTPESPPASEPPAPDSPDSPEADRAFDLPSID